MVVFKLVVAALLQQCSPTKTDFLLSKLLHCFASSFHFKFRLLVHGVFSAVVVKFILKFFLAHCLLSRTYICLEVQTFSYLNKVFESSGLLKLCTGTGIKMLCGGK